MAKFRARARTVDMLGRQQIAGIPTAISELFKNAHDAYAEKVEVDYFRAEDLFVLRDDGIGMTEDEFIDRWLAIGTESKLGARKGLPPPPKPPGMEERPMLGEKGIGRLAIGAVGPQVLILSRAKRGKRIHDTVMSFINWGLFEVPGVNLDDIDIPVITYSEGDLPSRDDVLTSVELFRENVDKLREAIDPPLAERILSELARFDVDPKALDGYLRTISGPSLTESGHGTHFLILPTRRSLLLDIESDITSTLIGFSNTMARGRQPRIKTSFRDHNSPETFNDLINPDNFFTPDEFKTADHHFEGEFNDYGQFTGHVTIYEKEPIKQRLAWDGNKRARTECGPFRLNLAYVQGDAKESLLPRDAYVSITRKLDKLGGLYIYKDGIRVLPYGRSDYDFLELEQRRTRGAGYYYFSYRRMFGYVEIGGVTNPHLTEKAGREGFIQNTAYRQFRSILKNFFLQIAAAFFRKGGEYTGVYEGRRTELKRHEAVRRAREKDAKEDRKKLAVALDEKFEKVQSEIPERDIAQLVETVAEEIKTASNLEDELRASAAIMEIETTAHNVIDDLRKSYKLTKPRGLGLTTKLRKEWELWTKESDRLEREVFQPAKQHIETIISEAAQQQHLSKKDLLQRIDQSLKNRIAEAKTTLNQENAETKQAAEVVRKKILRITTDGATRLGGLIEDVKLELARLKQSNRKEGSILGEYYKLEEGLSESVERERLILENTRLHLLQFIDAAVSSDEVIEALEEENLALHEQSESDVELAQLGMAVAVISHEFESTVRSIRSNLLRLKGWADVNKELKDLYRQVRADFDHLEAYLQLFTPLERRSVPNKVLIRGSDIAKYLRDLFSDRLRAIRAEIQSTNIFSRMAIKGYPATFYPVFVNLVDNSLFWLKDSSEPRIIKLDIMGGSTWVVSDNGPGVAIRDRELIFERGFTRKPGGRGMGLKISRDVLARAGYDLLLADSRPGDGTTFLIKLKPLNKEGEY